MRIFLILLVVAALLIFALLGFRGADVDRPPQQAATPPAGGPAAVPEAAKRDFRQLITLLQQDMDKIPMPLDAPRVVPANAFSIQSRLEGFADRQEAYQALYRVCELIIYADQARSVRQRECGLNQDKVSTNALSSLSPEARGPAMAAQRAAIYQQQQALWSEERKKTDVEVKRLLATLENKRL